MQLRNKSICRVVTGIRFLKLNGIIYIQIKEGKLGPSGQIEPTGTRWLEPSKQFKKLTIHQNERDFVLFNYHHSQIDLDDVFIPMTHIVTGVKFGVDAHTKHIRLAIRGTKYNYTSGQLDLSLKSTYKFSNVYSR